MTIGTGKALIRLGHKGSWRVAIPSPQMMFHEDDGERGGGDKVDGHCLSWAGWCGTNKKKRLAAIDDARATKTHSRSARLLPLLSGLGVDRLGSSSSVLGTAVYFGAIV